MVSRTFLSVACALAAGDVLPIPPSCSAPVHAVATRRAHGGGEGATHVAGRPPPAPQAPRGAAPQLAGCVLDGNNLLWRDTPGPRGKVYDFNRLQKIVTDLHSRGCPEIRVFLSHALFTSVSEVLTSDPASAERQSYGSFELARAAGAQAEERMGAAEENGTSKHVAELRARPLVLGPAALGFFQACTLAGPRGDGGAGGAKGGGNAWVVLQDLGAEHMRAASEDVEFLHAAHAAGAAAAGRARQERGWEGDVFTLVVSNDKFRAQRGAAPFALRRIAQRVVFAFYNPVLGVFHSNGDARNAGPAAAPGATAPLAPGKRALLRPLVGAGAVARRQRGGELVSELDEAAPAELLALWGATVTAAPRPQLGAAAAGAGAALGSAGEEDGGAQVEAEKRWPLPEVRDDEELKALLRAQWAASAAAARAGGPQEALAGDAYLVLDGLTNKEREKEKKREKNAKKREKKKAAKKLLARAQRDAGSGSDLDEEETALPRSDRGEGGEEAKKHATTDQSSSGASRKAFLRGPHNVISAEQHAANAREREAAHRDALAGAAASAEKQAAHMQAVRDAAPELTREKKVAARRAELELRVARHERQKQEQVEAAREKKIAALETQTRARLRAVERKLGRGGGANVARVLMPMQRAMAEEERKGAALNAKMAAIKATALERRQREMRSQQEALDAQRKELAARHKEEDAFWSTFIEKLDQTKDGWEAQFVAYANVEQAAGRFALEGEKYANKLMLLRNCDKVRTAEAAEAAEAAAGV